MMHKTKACNFNMRVCHGSFCHFIIADNSKYLTYPGKSKIFEKDFSLIPKSNKIFVDNLNFSVTGILIKRVNDNMDIALEIIYKHRLFISQDKEFNEAVTTNYI